MHHSQIIRHIPVLLALGLIVGALTPQSSNSQTLPASRTWTRKDGKTVQAELIGFDAGQVLLRTADGQIARPPIDQLSANDQTYVVLNIDQQLGPAVRAQPDSPASSVASASSTPVYAKTWPTTLTAPDGLSDARYMESVSKPGSFVYRSRRFEYIAHSMSPLNVAVMKDVARVFEGTFELLSRSPIGVQAEPVDGFFRAELWVTMTDYHKAGGPVGSGGVYLTKEKKFLVPFDSLGLRLGPGDTWIKDKDFQVTTLVHEITHMMMHDILPLLPKWVIEGTAEYTECIPFKYGTFDHTKLLPSVKNYNAARFGRRISGPPIEDFARILQPERPRRAMTSGSGPRVEPTFQVPQMAFYHSSMLMVYYFMQLEGDGKGTRFLDYLSAVREEKLAYDGYRKSFDSYRAEMDEFLKKPGVKLLPDGRFTYPLELKPPTAPKAPKPQYDNGDVENIHSAILLGGRTLEEVAADADQKLSKLGIRTR